MKELIEGLRIEAERLRNSNPTRESLATFILRLKNLISEVKHKEINKDIMDLLYSIESFRSFDELPWMNKVFQHLMIFRSGPSYYYNWKGKGKYQYDFDALIIKLDALLYRLARSRR